MLNLLLALLAFPLLLALLAFVLILREYILDRRARRHNFLYRFNPDPNGNYPIYHDLSFTAFTPPPGNAAYPNQLIHSNGVVKEVKQIVKPVALNLPDTGYKWGNSVSAEIVETPQIEAETAPKMLSETDISAFIQECKQKGIGKTRAAALLNIKPGASAAYLNFTAKWNEV